MIEHGASPWGTDASWDEVWTRALACARRYARHPADAEDIAQEAVIRAWRHRESLRERERFSSWLATIVRREAARDAAKARPEPAEATDREPAADEWVAEIATRADVQVGLRRLEPDEQLLLRLRYEEDLTQEAIARSLDLPEGTVKVRLHRARHKLHRLLSDP